MGDYRIGRFTQTEDGDGNPGSITHNQTTTAEGVSSDALADTGDTEGPHHGNPLSDFAAAIRENRQPITVWNKLLSFSKLRMLSMHLLKPELLWR